MGKFAGFLKRAKKIVGIGMNVLNSFNDIYKGIKPFAEPIVGALPFGNYINKGLDAASTVIDKVQPFTNRWLNDKDKLTSSRISNSVQKFVDKATQGLLNNGHEILPQNIIQLIFEIYINENESLKINT